MRRLYLTVAAAGFLAALGGIAEAKGPGPGGVGGQPSTPPGFGNPGGHEGFSSTTDLPKGWSTGTADWKADAANKETPLLPPGFTKSNSRP